MIKLANLLAQIYEKLNALYTSFIIDLPEKVNTLANRICALINEIWANDPCNDPSNPNIPNTPSRIDELEDKVNPSYQGWNDTKKDTLDRVYVIRKTSADSSLILNKATLINVYRDYDFTSLKQVTPFDSKFIEIRYILDQEIVYPVYSQAMLIPSASGTVYDNTLNVEQSLYYDLFNYTWTNLQPPFSYTIPIDNAFLIDIKPTNNSDSGRFIDVNPNPFNSSTSQKWITPSFKIFIEYDTGEIASHFKINFDRYFPVLYLTYATRRLTELEFLIQPKLYKISNVPSSGLSFSEFSLKVRPFFFFLKKDVIDPSKLIAISGSELSSEFGANPNGTIDIGEEMRWEGLFNLSNGGLTLKEFKSSVWSGSVINSTTVLFPPESIAGAVPFIGIGFKASLEFELTTLSAENEKHLIFVVFQNVSIYTKQKLTHFWASEPHTSIVVL